MTGHTADTNANPLNNASNILKGKRKRDFRTASLPAVGSKARETPQASDGLFVEQEKEMAADSQSGEPSGPSVKRRRMADLHASIEEITDDEAPKTTSPAFVASVESINTATNQAATSPRETTGSLQPGQDRSAGPTPSSIIVIDVEDLESLPRTKVTRSRDELGKAVREYCLAHCGKLEAVFKTREDQRALGFHLVFRGASVKLQGSATLKSLIANLQKEVVPFLKAARTIVQTECKEYRDFYDKIKDRVDKDIFKTILTRSERKVKDVQKAMKFIANLLEDLGEQQRSLLRKKFDVPASA